jgi:hypothetical protein
VRHVLILRRKLGRREASGRRAGMRSQLRRRIVPDSLQLAVGAPRQVGHQRRVDLPPRRRRTQARAPPRDISAARSDMSQGQPTVRS